MIPTAFLQAWSVKAPWPDLRQEYSEQRFITVGLLESRMVVLVWTPRGEARRIVSMRKANDREQARYAHFFA